MRAGIVKTAVLQPNLLLLIQCNKRGRRPHTHPEPQESEDDVHLPLLAVVQEDVALVVQESFLHSLGLLERQEML